LDGGATAADAEDEEDALRVGVLVSFDRTPVTPALRPDLGSPQASPAERDEMEVAAAEARMDMA
jgi:hypothetical protein